MYNVPNLITLRDWLRANESYVSAHLEMDSYITGMIAQLNMSNVPECAEAMSCGTSCCFAGWAAVSGEFSLALPTTPESELSCEAISDIPMLRFVYNTFIHLEGTHLDDEKAGAYFTYLFGGGWTDDFEAGMTRIDYAIEHGHPKWEDIDLGEE